MPISCRKSGIYYRATAIGLLRCATAIKMPKATVIPVTRDEAVDITPIFLICCRPVVIRRSFRLPGLSRPATFPPPTTKPLAGAVSKTATAMSVIENLPPGNVECVRLLLVAMPYRASPFLLMNYHYRRGVRGIKPQFASGN